jgi:hypothetical protein
MSARQIAILVVIIVIMIMRSGHFGGLGGWPF